MYKINKDIKPYENMRLKYIGNHNFLKGEVAIAHRNNDGSWYVVWSDNQQSVSGSTSGVEDDGVHDCWEVLDNNVSKNAVDIKSINMKPESLTCFLCGENLKEPYPGLKHCPKCEP